MSRDTISPNVPGLDTGLPAGRVVTSREVRFAYDLAAGGTIATLVDPFGSGSTFATAGTVPAQLALSGSNIIRGAGAATLNSQYSIWIVVTSPDGIPQPAVRLTFRALLPFGGVPSIVLPATVFYKSEGDSITVSLGTGNAASSYPAMAVQGATRNPPVYYPLTNGDWWTANSGGNTLVGNIATSGLRVSGTNGSGPGMDTGYSTRLGAAYNGSYALSIMSIQGGRNDGAVSEVRATYKGLRSVSRKATTTGYMRKIIGTLISTGNVGEALSNDHFDGTTLPLNVLIRKLWDSDMDYDYLADYGNADGLKTRAEFTFASGLAATNLGDAAPVHPTAAGNALMAPILRAALNAAIAGLGTRSRGPMEWSEIDIARATLSGGGKIATCVTAAPGNGRAYPAIFNGEKRFFELRGSSNEAMGLCSQSYEDLLDATYIHQTTTAFAVLGDGNIYYNNGTIGAAGGAYTPPQVIQFAIDRVNGKLWARYPGGNWNNNGTANPATNVGGLNIPIVGSGPLYPAYGNFSVGGTTTLRATAAEMTAAFTIVGFKRLDEA